MEKVYLVFRESTWRYSDDGRDDCLLLGVFSSQEKAEEHIKKQIEELTYSEASLNGEKGKPFYHPSWGDYESYFIEIRSIDDTYPAEDIVEVITKTEWEF